MYNLIIIKVIPYSLHSNFEELELFISIIKPKKLFPIVKNSEKQS